MGVEDNKKTVQLVEEAYNRGDLDSLDQYFAANFDNAEARPPFMPAGLDMAKQMHQMSMQSFPDRKTEIVEMIGEGNKVMARIRLTGTNTGGVAWVGAPANDAKVDMTYVSVFDFDDDGKIVKHFGLNDIFSLGMQLGVIEPPQM